MKRVFIDIETIAAQSENATEILKSNINDQIAKLKAPGNYGEVKAAEYVAKKTAELQTGYTEQHLKTSLNGDLGEIITIGFSIEGEQPRTVHRKNTANNPEGEAAIIEQAFESIAEEVKLNGGSLDSVQWVGHNVIKFDLPFIYKRCVINNIKPPFAIPANARHGSNAFDTMQAWSGYGNRISQDNLCKLLNLPTKQGMDGSKVYQAWLDGKDSEISQYCKDDVQTVIDLYKRLNFIDALNGELTEIPF